MSGEAILPNPNQVQIVLTAYGNHALLRIEERESPPIAILIDERSLARLILEGQLLLWRLRGFPRDRQLAGD